MSAVLSMRILAVVLTAFAVLASTRAEQPATLPLVQASDVVYLGIIRAPAGAGLGIGPNSLAVDGTKLYYGCYGGSQTTGVAVLTLPAIGGTAQLLTPCAPLPNTDQVHRNTNPPYLDIIAGGILPFGGRLIVSGWTYYDGSGGQIKSHWAGPDASSVSGPYTMAVSDVPMQSNGTTTWFRESMVGGYMGIIPLEWRALLGGPALTGQCCIPIISRSSYGPSFSVFDPAHVGTVNPIPSKMLVGYPDEHKTLGLWDASPPGQYYGGTDQLGSVGFPAGTRSILLTGRHGDNFCYGPATADPALVGTPGPGAYKYCYDPLDSMQGNHGPPYRPTMWAYDANELVAVKNGTKKPWDVQPYAKWQLPGMSTTVQNYLRAGYYEPATKRYYVGSTNSLDIHVFSVTVGTAPPPPPPPPPVDCQVSAWSAWAPVSATTEQRTRTVTVAPANGGLACPALIETRPIVVLVTLTATMTTKTCTLVVTDTPPDALGGWSVQFYRNSGVSHGSADASAPYTRSATVNAGTYDISATWTKAGQSPVVRAFGIKVCP